MAETEQPATETKPQTTAEANGQSGAQSAESAARPEAGTTAETTEKPAGTTAETGQPSSGQPPQMAETAKTAGEVTAAPAAKPVSGGQASGQSPATTATGEAATKPASPSERMGTETVQEVAKAGQPPTEEEVRPIHTGESVIIRRGDNLWTISRRMLGAGIKYTVIYEANRGQIRNPHWIFPGQVFDVPGAMQPMPRK